MTDFSSWSHESLVKFAENALTEVIYLKHDLRTAIDAYRALVKETHDAPHLQQLPTQQVQPNRQTDIDG